MADQEQEHLPARREEAEGSGQQDLFASDYIELEKARIASFDRRTDVAKAAIDANRESEKEVFAYHMRRLETVEAQHQREHRFASRFVWGCFIAAVAIGGGLTWMAFYGNPEQRAIALQILSNVYKWASGAGGFVLLRQVWRRLFHRPPEE